MRKFLGFLTILILLSTGTSLSCPNASTGTAVASFPSLPLGSPLYYCAASPAPQTIGDLSYDGWAKHVQVCSINCSYEPASPADPQSPLIASNCGMGRHAATYLVVPPAPAPAGTGLKITSTSCGSTPSKAGTPATPSPRQ